MKLESFKRVLVDKKIGLVDVLMAMAVIGVVALSFHPGWLSWKNKSSVTNAATNLKSDLEAAKLRAARENATVTILFSSDGYEIFLDNGTGGGVRRNFIRDGSEIRVKKRKIPKGLVLVTDFPTNPPGSTTTGLQFYGYGRPSASGSLRLAGSDRRERCLTVNPTGRVKMEKGTT